MIILTTFRNGKNFYLQGSKTLAMTRKCPKWYNGDKYLKLAAPDDLVSDLSKGIIIPYQFSHRYKKYLDTNYIQDVVSDIDSFRDSDECIYLLYPSSNNHISTQLGVFSRYLKVHGINHKIL